MIPFFGDFCIDSRIRVLENDIFHSPHDFVLSFKEQISQVIVCRYANYSHNADVVQRAFLALSADRSILSDLTIQSFATDFSGYRRRLATPVTSDPAKPDKY